MKKFGFTRVIALLTLALFFHAQVLSFAQIPQSEAPLSEVSAPAVSEAPAISENKIQPTDPTFAFLEKETVLVPVEETEHVEEITEVETAGEIPAPGTFDQVLDRLNQAKGFAMAAVGKLTVENLAKLARQAWEFGIAVVKGIILLFTSHDHHGIAVTRNARAILDRDSDFLLHKQSYGEKDPSSTDILGASVRGKTEYVVSLASSAATNLDVVAYDGQGNKADFDSASLLRIMDALVDPSYSSYAAVLGKISGISSETRDELDFYRSDPPPEINPDPSNPPITTVPQNAQGNRPLLEGIARTTTPSGGIDWSHTDVSMVSATRAEARYQQYNSSSWGWAQVNYDNPDTPSVNETIHLPGAFPDGMVFGLSSADLTEVILQVTDVNGQTARVILKGITSTAKRWKIPTNLFEGADLTRITKISVGLEGRYPDARLNIDCAGLWYVPPVASDPSNPAITTLPATSQGTRPTLTASASSTTPSGGVDYSSMALNQSSKTDFTVTTSLFNSFSQGRVGVSYDNPATTPHESINLSTTYPNGFVFSIDSNHFSQIYLEVTDQDGKTDRVLLTGITSSGKKFKINSAFFDDVDTSHITAINFLVEGRYINQQFHVSWGDFVYDYPVTSDPSNPALTPLPLSQNKPPSLTGSASSQTPSGGTDYSNVEVDMRSTTSALLNFYLYNTFSSGGAAMNFPDSFNLGSVFPNGIVFALSNYGSAVTDVVFEIKDASGKTDRVLISGITGAAKKFKLASTVFDEIDLTHVVSMGFKTSGRLIGQTLMVGWGTFGNISEITGTGYQENTLTTLNNNPSLTALGSNLDPFQAPAGVELEQTSSSEFNFVFNRTVSSSSAAAVTLVNGGYNQYGIFEGTTANLPESFVLAARGTEDGRLRVTLKDVSGKLAVFILKLRPAYQNFVLDLSSGNVPQGFDRTKIAFITFGEDEKTGAPFANDLVKVKIPGLNYTPPSVPPASQAVKDMLLNKGMSFFTTDRGLDPGTHFPYDSIEADGHPLTDPVHDARFTQPTLIGFYAELLGQVVTGNLANGMNTDQALTEINTVMTNLLSFQSQYGWKGLLPWMKLQPTIIPRTQEVALGDNANLTHSLAALYGALETASLNASQASAAAALKTKIDQYLNNQAAGYTAMVDPISGALFQKFVRDTLTSESGSFPTFYMDRLANEFRGVVIFLQVRYNLPSTVSEAMQIKYNNYTDSGGSTIKNLAYYDGGAFQAFWPLLRSRESDFIGFRNALENAFVSYTDFSSQNKIPGFVSASQRPSIEAAGAYEGRLGIRQIAEAGIGHADQFVSDVGSVYALASAYSLDPAKVLEWLASIREQVPGLETDFGFYDAARSNSEIAKRTLGIDQASLLLGLLNTGANHFEAYLRAKNLEMAHNVLYDQISRQIAITQTAIAPDAPPVFPDRTLAVFSHGANQGHINNFNGGDITPAGVHPIYGSLASNGGYGGYYWILDQSYDARSNKLIIKYQSQDTPVNIKLELKNSSGQTMAVYTPALVNTSDDKTITIDLAATVSMADIKEVVVVIDQNATGDTSGNFIIHSIDFQHFPS